MTPFLITTVCLFLLCLDSTGLQSASQVPSRTRLCRPCGAGPAYRTIPRANALGFNIPPLRGCLNPIGANEIAKEWRKSSSARAAKRRNIVAQGVSPGTDGVLVNSPERAEYSSRDSFETLGARIPIQSQTLEAPNGIAIEGRNNLFVSDIATHRILKIDSRGQLHIVAGTGEAGYSGDNGPARQAKLNAPHDLIFDAEGNLIIADSGNHRIRRIDRKGVITTIAGDGKPGKSGYNEPASATSLNYPQGLALDAAGNLLIADTYNHVVRKLDAKGKMTTLAGSVAGYGGDGGPAVQAQFSLPMAVAVAPDGSVYISDAGNSRIRRVSPAGNIQTIAGYGPAQDTYGGGFAGEGVAVEKAKLFSATDLKCDSKGNLYIVDSGNNRVRVVRNGIITTLAGNGEAGMKNDGKAAVEAQLNSPQKLALARDGGVFITDRANRSIRKVAVNGIIVTIQPSRSK